MLSSALLWERINSFSRTLLFVAALGYCFYHTVSGDRGLFALLQLSQRIEKEQTELDIARAERMQLEHRVTLLRHDSLDLDLLDEQARKVLGYARKDEEIFTVKTPQ